MFVCMYVYTSAECNHQHEAPDEKNLPVVTLLLMLYCPLEMIGMKEWERTIRIQFIGVKKKMFEVTNLQMYTWCKTVNRHEHLNLAKFKSCGTRANKGGINLNVELRRRKAQTSSGCKKYNFEDTEWSLRFLKWHYSSIWWCCNKPHNLTQF